MQELLQQLLEGIAVSVGFDVGPRQVPHRDGVFGFKFAGLLNIHGLDGNVALGTQMGEIRHVGFIIALNGDKQTPVSSIQWGARFFNNCPSWRHSFALCWSANT